MDVAFNITLKWQLLTKFQTVLFSDIGIASKYFSMPPQVPPGKERIKWCDSALKVSHIHSLSSTYLYNSKDNNMQQELVGGCTIRPQKNLTLDLFQEEPCPATRWGGIFVLIFALNCQLHHDGFVLFGNSAYNKAGPNLCLWINSLSLRNCGKFQHRKRIDGVQKTSF